jgi:hypothetical protein
MTHLQRRLLWWSGHIIPYSVTCWVTGAILPLLDFERLPIEGRIGGLLLWYTNAQGAMLIAERIKKQ